MRTYFPLLDKKQTKALLEFSIENIYMFLELIKLQFQQALISTVGSSAEFTSNCLIVFWRWRLQLEAWLKQDALLRLRGSSSHLPDEVWSLSSTVELLLCEFSMVPKFPQGSTTANTFYLNWNTEFGTHLEKNSGKIFLYFPDFVI